jgi:DNA-binding CsgD family transcriptional regulator
MNIKNLEQSFTLLETVLEGFIDGILILSCAGELIYSNQLAQSICQRLNQNSASTKDVPQEIWRAGQALIESCELYFNQEIVIESEVPLGETVIRIRVQWLQLNSVQSPCLLVRLEDQQQVLRNLANAESDLYGLTPRETEVWQLRRLGYSRKAIANTLYIALDTVKKHLKNIYAKQQARLDEEEWQLRRVS